MFAEGVYLGGEIRVERMSGHALLQEKGLPVDEVYEQNRAIRGKAWVPNEETYERMYKQSLESPHEFWTKISYQQVRWMRPRSTVVVAVVLVVVVVVE